MSNIQIPNVCGLPIQEAMDRLMDFGVVVSVKRFAGKKPVLNADSERVVRQKCIEPTVPVVELLTSCFKTTATVE